MADKKRPFKERLLSWIKAKAFLIFLLASAYYFSKQVYDNANLTEKIVFIGFVSLIGLFFASVWWKGIKKKSRNPLRKMSFLLFMFAFSANLIFGGGWYYLKTDGAKAKQKAKQEQIAESKEILKGNNETVQDNLKKKIASNLEQEYFQKYAKEAYQSCKVAVGREVLTDIKWKTKNLSNEYVSGKIDMLNSKIHLNGKDIEIKNKKGVFVDAYYNCTYNTEDMIAKAEIKYEKP